MKPLTIGSLFSGIGAFERALEKLNLNYNLKYYCEIDKYVSTTYSAIHNVSEELNLGDITKINIDSLPYIDLITHGSPCQDFSIAGKQKGGNKNSNTRSSLMWHTVEIIKKINPKYVIWENVKNVLSDKHVHNFEKYKKTLRELGYKNYSKLINAKHWGIPQNRERIFIVSIRKDIDKGFNFPISSLEGQQSLFNQNVIDIEPKVLRDVLEDQVDEKYYISDDKTEKLLQELTAKEIGINPVITPDRLDKRQNGRRFKEDNEEMFTLTGQDRHGVGILKNKGEWKLKNNNIATCLDANYYKGIDNHQARTGILELRQIGGFDNSKFNLNSKKGYQQGMRIYSIEGISCTLNSESGGIGAKTGLYMDKYRIRKLTPLECFRLMGFNDEDYFKAKKSLEDKYYNGADRSDSQCYKMAGNSIVVNVLEYIFKELFKGRLKVAI